ncbi:hypothetical protein IEQ34_011978 [Dendrobium chrysotoxum]|uniref:Uncharacterized protein n=1 Tax=Dendrobium chrysotoxum TaxID=161865 RepID=A0AAV7GBL5_DENCH|nr:hypothetical protein IEQ34_011978 [Dendrobium chrysotoxum]
MINSGENLRDTGRVRDHAHSPLHLGKIAARHNSWRLVVDSAFEASGAPVNKLDRAFSLDGGYRGIDILGHHIATIHQAASHVFAMAGIAFGHHGGWLEGAVGDFSNGELLVVGFFSRDYGSIG